MKLRKGINPGIITIEPYKYGVIVSSDLSTDDVEGGLDSQRAVFTNFSLMCKHLKEVMLEGDSDG